MPNPHEAWEIADTTCRGIAEVFNAYGAAVRAEPIARDYTSHWGFFPTLNGRVVPHSIPLFVEKATGRVLSYGEVPAGTYPEYVGPTPKITWSDSIPVTAE